MNAALEKKIVADYDKIWISEYTKVFEVFPGVLVSFSRLLLLGGCDATRPLLRGGALRYFAETQPLSHNSRSRSISVFFVFVVG